MKRRQSPSYAQRARGARLAAELPREFLELACGLELRTERGELAGAYCVSAECLVGGALRAVARRDLAPELGTQEPIDQQRGGRLGAELKQVNLERAGDGQHVLGLGGPPGGLG